MKSEAIKRAELLEYKRQYYIANKERLRKKGKEWQEKNAEKVKARKARLYIDNQEQHRIKGMAYRAKNKDAIRLRAIDHYQNNRDRLLKKSSAWQANNKERRAEYFRERRKGDPLYNLSSSLRSRIGYALRRGAFTKSNSTHEILGCSIGFFKSYIEQRFLPGMSWANRSEWHLDHITPVITAKTEKEVYKLNHYTNFRPLWAEDNLSKWAKVPEQLTLMAA